MTELVLPLVVRIERDDPPQRTDALAAAAIATLRMLTTENPDWRDAVTQWDGQRIRKVVRRARGAAWRRARTVDGLDVVRGSAELRVYPPVPIDDWPPELVKLQVGGTNLTDNFVPELGFRNLPLVLLSPHVEMSTGKAMAQVGHAAQLGWRAASPRRRQTWAAGGFQLAVRDAATAQWDDAIAAGAQVVHDGGFTEVEPGTATALFRL